jgi:phosphoglycerol transferase MdoB-like AlkP superfamily enzyme
MKKHFQYLFFTFLAWILTFWAARFVFLVYNFEKTKALGFSDIVGSFLHGLLLDLSFTSYILLLFIPFWMINIFFPIKKILTFLTALVLAFILVLVFIDIELYSAWNFRIDSTVLVYFKNLTEMTASASSSPVFLLLFSFAITFFIFYKIFKKTFDFLPNFNEKSNNWLEKTLNVLLLSVVGAFLIIPMRGGIQHIPINQSDVYFSKSQFANHAAINPIWNFFDAIVMKKDLTENPYQYFSKAESQQIIDSLYADNQPFERIFRKEITHPNVILVVWESLTSKLVEKAGGTVKGATPYLDELIDEGILFKNAYASGDRTDKGIVAVLSAFPAQPIASIVQETKKSDKLPLISQDFSKNGYETAFYYGGELNFAGMKSYLMNGSFDKIISKNEFSKEDCNSKWGAFDHVVYNRVLGDLSRNKPKKPFFKTILTLTSHEPFEIPEFEGNFEWQNAKDEATLFANSQFYASSAFSKFIRTLKNLPNNIWANTVVVVVGDHGTRLIDAKTSFEHYKTPIIWLGGALEKDKKGKIYEKVVSQLDIANSLLQQNNFDAKKYIWSKNMFSTDNQHFAYCSFKDGFGFFNDKNQLLFDNVGKIFIEKQGTETDVLLKKGKALQQMTFEDYLKK